MRESKERKCSGSRFSLQLSHAPCSLGSCEDRHTKDFKALRYYVRSNTDSWLK